MTHSGSHFKWPAEPGNKFPQILGLCTCPYYNSKAKRLRELRRVCFSFGNILFSWKNVKTNFKKLTRTKHPYQICKHFVDPVNQKDQSAPYTLPGTARPRAHAGQWGNKRGQHIATGLHSALRRRAIAPRTWARMMHPGDIRPSEATSHRRTEWPHSDAVSKVVEFWLPGAEDLGARAGTGGCFTGLELRLCRTTKFRRNVSGRCK